MVPVFVCNCFVLDLGADEYCMIFCHIAVLTGVYVDVSIILISDMRSMIQAPWILIPAFFYDMVIAFSCM